MTRNLVLPLNDDVVLAVDAHARAQDARELFRHPALKKAAYAIGHSSERAAQYLHQAPVIALAFAARKNGGDHSKFDHTFSTLAAAGAKLSDVMWACGIAPQFRPLKASILGPAQFQIVKLLSALPASTLGRIVPKAAGDQRRWLAGLQEWRSVLARRIRSLDTFAWAAERMAIEPFDRRDVVTVCDFATDPQTAFNPAWKWSRALEEARRWHMVLHLTREHLPPGVGLETRIDHGAHPDKMGVNDFDFVALRRPLDLFEEGHAMHHCVATYIREVAMGGCHIVGVRDTQGRRVATLELRGGQLIQLQAHANTNPPKSVWDAARGYIQAIRPKPEPSKMSGRKGYVALSDLGLSFGLGLLRPDAAVVRNGMNLP